MRRRDRWDGMSVDANVPVGRGVSWGEMTDELHLITVRAFSCVIYCRDGVMAMASFLDARGDYD